MNGEAPLKFDGVITSEPKPLQIEHAKDAADQSTLGESK
jgi:hypothetical protein